MERVIWTPPGDVTLRFPFCRAPEVSDASRVISKRIEEAARYEYDVGHTLIAYAITASEREILGGDNVYTTAYGDVRLTHQTRHMEWSE